MYSITKVVSVLSCGVLLCLGLSQAAHAGLADEAGASRLAQAKVVKGDLVRVDYSDYIVKDKDGQEVRVHMTNKTQIMGQLKKGDRIEVKLDDKDNALSIRSLP
jgi:translation initiation factor IF-1